jgi:prepilin-type processing-associated H-X9-DG protein
MAKPGRVSFANVVLERGAAVMQVVDPQNPNVVFVGGWRASVAKIEAVVVIAIHPGAPIHEAEARVRHDSGINALMCDGSVRVLDLLKQELASYGTTMQPLIFGEANFFHSAVIGPLRAHGAALTPGWLAPPQLRTAQAIIFTSTGASPNLFGLQQIVGAVGPQSSANGFMKKVGSLDVSK